MSVDTAPVEQALYQCPRCSVQWAGPDVDERRVCECHRAIPLGGQRYMERVGTIDVERDGWTRLGPAAEVLQKGYAVRYENENRLRLEDNGVWQDWSTEDEPVPGEIHGVEETRHGPRYEICPDADWWHPEREDSVPSDHVWHWEIVEVTERTRASVRVAELQRERER